MNRRILIAVLVFAFASILFTLPIFSQIENWGQKDWDQFTMWNAVPHKTILTYHQIPLWNPYVNGGNVMLAHPHSPLLSPFFIFVLIFGPVLGLKIQITVHLFLGLLGMYVLSKKMEMKGLSAYLSAFVFMCCAIYPLHLSEGHTEWFSMAFVPWYFLFYLKSLNKTNNIIGGIIFLSLILLNGSVDVFNIMIVFMGCFAILKSIEERRFDPLKVLAMIWGGTFLLCAVKLIPMLDFVGQNPRLTDETSGVPFSVLYHMLFNPDQKIFDLMTWWEGYQMGLTYEWHEYGAFIGFIPAILFCLGTFQFFRIQWALIITGAAMLFIALGHNSPLNLWKILHSLPYYDSLTVPSRFIMGFIFVVSIISGLAYQRFETYIRSKKKDLKRYVQIIPKIVFLLVVIDLYGANAPVFENAFRVKPIVLKNSNWFTQRYNEILLQDDNLMNSTIYPVFLSNSGILKAYEVVQIKQGEVKDSKNPEYKGEYYLDKPAGQVNLEYFSPNKLEYTVEVNQPNLLMINQNFHKGWRAKMNGKKADVTSAQGLISVILPKGKYHLSVYYLPESFLVGLLVSMIFLILMGVKYYQSKAISIGSSD